MKKCGLRWDSRRRQKGSPEELRYLCINYSLRQSCCIKSRNRSNTVDLIADKDKYEGNSQQLQVRVQNWPTGEKRMLSITCTYPFPPHRPLSTMRDFLAIIQQWGNYGFINTSSSELANSKSIILLFLTPEFWISSIYSCLLATGAPPPVIGGVIYVRLGISYPTKNGGDACTRLKQNRGMNQRGGIWREGLEEGTPSCFPGPGTVLAVKLQ